MFSEFPGAKRVAEAHLTRLKTILNENSRGRYDRDKAIEIRDAARRSIGSLMPAKSLELRHTIALIHELDTEIEEIETEIQAVMETIQSPITTIPGIGLRMGAMILAEIGDFSLQSGQLSLNGAYSHMEKRGSRYLRYAIYNATKYVCLWESSFAAYLARKRALGKHYNVAISHAAKKLVRLIFAMERSGQVFRCVA